MARLLVDVELEVLVVVHETSPDLVNREVLVVLKKADVFVILESLKGKSK